MEKVKPYFNFFVVIAILLIMASALILLSAQSQVEAQEDSLTELTNKLIEQGVPVKDIQIANYNAEETNQPQLQLKVVLQSTSDEDIVTSEDPLFIHTVQREIALAQNQQEIQFDTVSITILNSLGNTIYWSDVPVRNVLPVTGSQLDDATLTTMLLERLSLHGFSLNSLTVSSDIKGTSVLSIQLDVEDVQTANDGLPQFMFDLHRLLEELNSDHVQIAICKLEIVDINQGQTLLKYVKDFQLAQQNWWQAETLTKEWFPHPPSPR
jgi:hypothetical protein